MMPDGPVNREGIRTMMDNHALTAPTLECSPSIRHGFFTRLGGVSTGIFSSLNCGLGSGDDRDAVLENRERVVAMLTGDQTPTAPLISPYQVHGTHVIRVDETTTEREEADGIITTAPGVTIGVLSADCGPILFADPDNGVIGAAHAGWKGAVAGVLQSTVAAMEAAGAQRGSIHAVLGPTISQPSYEVGSEFETRIVDASPDDARFFTIPEGQTRAHFDLPGFILSRLNALDLASAGKIDVCTYRDEARFFSFRRATHKDETDYGRQISAIVLS